MQSQLLTDCQKPIRCPFPWFGGKSKVAAHVWDRFGAVPNFVEPFFGSGAVLFGRPTIPGIETANDKDCYLSNFWRSIQQAPDEVAYYASWPVNEADLHARHLWLVQQSEFRERMRTDPDYFDAKIAGWWVWGLCQWIGSGWCEHPEWEQLPHLGNAGMGVHRPSQQLPHLGNAGRGELYGYFKAIAARLARVRVCCGDWKRVLGPTPTEKLGVTGVFLDPPYSAEADRDASLYSVEDLGIAHEVREWALANGDNPMLRIAMCGYEGEHVMPESWECLAWKAKGGYGSQGNGRARENAGRERIWFSPHCRRAVDLFSFAEIA